MVDIDKIYWGSMQVRPEGTNIWDYKYDFDDGTWTDAKLSSDWWSWNSTPIKASTNWLVFYNTSTDVGSRLRKQITIPSNAKSLTMYFKWVKSWSWGGVFWGLFSQPGNDYNAILLRITSNYWNPAANGLVAGTHNNYLHSKSYASAIEWEVTYNIQTWAWTSTIDGSTATWTEANLITPGQTAYITFELSKWYYANPSYIYKFYLSFKK